MNSKALVAKGILALASECAVFAALLFVSAGTVRWSAGWVFMAIFFGFALAITLWLGRQDSELLAERLSAPVQRGQPLWDKVFVGAIMPLFVVWLILMPLDAVRFGWSEVPVLLTDLGSSGTGAHFVHRVLDLPGERVSRPGGKGASGEGPECGDQRPVPVREASHVCEHVTVLPGKCTVVRLVGRTAVLCGASGATRLEDYPRRPDAKKRTARIRRVRPQREVPAHPRVW